MNINDIGKLYGKAVIETFDEKYNKMDIISRKYLEKSLLTKPIQDFYFSVGLRFIYEYLNIIHQEKTK